MQGISPSKETSILTVSNTGHWHNKDISVCACGSLSIPVVSTDLSVPQGAVLMLLKNGQKQRDRWSARYSSRRSPPVFASGVYTSSEEEFCISVFPAGLWVLPPPLITQVTFSFLLLCFLFLPN